MMMGNNTKNKNFSVIVVSLFLLTWFTIAKLGFVNNLLLPDPYRVLIYILESFVKKSYWLDIGATLSRALIALVLSSAFAIPCGLFIGRSNTLERSTRFTFDFLRSIPATALFPVFIIAFGTGEVSRIAASVLAATLLILVNTISGIRQANTHRLLVAKAYGAKGLKLFVHVLLPEALPRIMVGIRLATSLVLVINTLVEMFIGSTYGLGKKIIDSQLVYDIEGMYAYIITLGIIGYVMNVFVHFLEARYAHYASR
jgi:ABC-type nitrate/sulfonate/bicarbonate transport system permease component